MRFSTKIFLFLVILVILDVTAYDPDLDRCFCHYNCDNPPATCTLEMGIHKSSLKEGNIQFFVDGVLIDEWDGQEVYDALDGEYFRFEYSEEYWGKVPLIDWNGEYYDDQQHHIQFKFIADNPEEMVHSLISTESSMTPDCKWECKDDENCPYQERIRYWCDDETIYKDIETVHCIDHDCKGEDEREILVEVCPKGHACFVEDEDEPGVCIEVECMSSEDCGREEEEYTCVGGSVYLKTITPYCKKWGMNPSKWKCEYKDETDLVETCNDDELCDDGECIKVTTTTYTTTTTTTTILETSTTTVLETSTTSIVTTTIQETSTTTSSTTTTLSCEGCLQEGQCIPYGTRLEGEYCSLYKTLTTQKSVGSSCENNYECESNFCANSECKDIYGEVQETKGIVDRIVSFLKKIFRWN